MTTYQAIFGQSIFDVCLNTYGSLDYLLKLITDNGVPNINYTPFSGQQFAWDETLTEDQAVNQVSQNNHIIYATATLKNTSIISVVRVSEGEGFEVPKYYQPVNKVSLNYYQVTLEYQYSACGGENSFIVTDLIDGDVIQITRETQPLKLAAYSFNKNSGQITLNGAPLDQYETVYIIYSKIVTVPA